MFPRASIQGTPSGIGFYESSMLAIAFGSTIGLVLLYVSTGCLCLPAKILDNEPLGGYQGINHRSIQKCGSELTSMITLVCNGYFYNPYEDYSENTVKNDTRAPDFDHNGVVERCCKNPCDREFLKQHCRRQPKPEENTQETKEKESKNELSNFLKKRTYSGGKNDLQVQRGGDWRGRTRNDLHERKNVQPFEYGTIKPEILGGNPVIVGSRHGWPRGSSARGPRRTVAAQY